MSLVLRPYQTKAVADVRAQFGAGRKAPVLVLPTGGGKTQVAAFIIRAALERKRRVLFCAGRTELLDQTVDKLRNADVSDIRLIQAARDTGRPDAPVTVASIQTLTTKRWSGGLPPADLLILDEAHHGAAATWARLLNSYPGVHRLGLTATPERADGRPLGDLFDSIVTGPSVAELTKLEHLVPCVVYPPAGGAKLDPKQVALDPVAAYQLHGNNERAIVFCISRQHAASTDAEFRQAGIPSAVIDGAMAAGERRRVLADHRRGALRVLCSIGVLTEGYDDPGCSVAILARGFGHAGLFIQCAGRVLRPAPGKKRAILLDLVGSVLEHGTPDYERTYSLDGKAISGVAKDSITQCKVCGAVRMAGRPCANGCATPAMPFEAPEATGEGLTRITGTLAPRARRDFPIAMVSKRTGHCEQCRGRIDIGDQIYWTTETHRVKHQLCPL